MWQRKNSHAEESEVIFGLEAVMRQREIGGLPLQSSEEKRFACWILDF